MMGVVSPMMNGIGGDRFVIVYDAKANKLYGLNASGWAPRKPDSRIAEEEGPAGDAADRCVNTITVPGAVGRMAEAGGQIRP